MCQEVFWSWLWDLVESGRRARGSRTQAAGCGAGSGKHRPAGPPQTELGPGAWSSARPVEDGGGADVHFGGRMLPLGTGVGRVLFFKGGASPALTHVKDTQTTDWIRLSGFTATKVNDSVS